MVQNIRCTTSNYIALAINKFLGKEMPKVIRMMHEVEGEAKLQIEEDLQKGTTQDTIYDALKLK